LAASVSRRLSNYQTVRAASSGLAFDKYPFLARLGLKEDNLGCFNGKDWVGHGSTYTSKAPATGESLARVKFGDANDYESCLTNMEEVK
jgi:aldehyde dehydrogenase family 7 protein A1